MMLCMLECLCMMEIILAKFILREERLVMRSVIEKRNNVYHDNINIISRLEIFADSAG